MLSTTEFGSNGKVTYTRRENELLMKAIYFFIKLLPSQSQMILTLARISLSLNQRTLGTGLPDNLAVNLADSPSTTHRGSGNVINSGLDGGSS